MSTAERLIALIVDDDRATREVFEYALRMAGFDVMAANDGLSALRFIEQQLPDVIVLDLDLPYVSGLDVHQELLAHAETSRIPVVVVTGTEWDVPTGVRVLRKPITSDMLVKTVERILSGDADDVNGAWKPI